MRRHAGQQFNRFGAVTRIADKFGVFLELFPVTPLLDEGLIHQALGHDHMGQRGHNGHVGAGPQGKVMLRLDVV